MTDSTDETMTPAQAADELAAQSQEMGLYDEPEDRATPKLDGLPDPEVMNAAVERRKRRYEDEVVGPDGETRAEMRKVLLRHLDRLRTESVDAANRGEIDHKRLPDVLLRIHREQAALLGLNVAQYTVPW